MPLLMRARQWRVLRDHALKQYEDRVLRHVQRYFPDRCAQWGEEESRAQVRRGIERAESHGFVSQRDICLYVCLVFALHPDFDTDTDLPWAAAILADKDLDPPTWRLEVLLDRATAALEASDNGEPAPEPWTGESA